MQSQVFVTSIRWCTDDHHEPYATEIFGVYTSKKLAEKNKKKVIKKFFKDLGWDHPPEDDEYEVIIKAYPLVGQDMDS